MDCTTTLLLQPTTTRHIWEGSQTAPGQLLQLQQPDGCIDKEGERKLGEDSMGEPKASQIQSTSQQPSLQRGQTTNNPSSGRRPRLLTGRANRHSTDNARVGGLEENKIGNQHRQTRVQDTFPFPYSLSDTRRLRLTSGRHGWFGWQLSLYGPVSPLGAIFFFFISRGISR
ncbi:hypothetical protein VTI74DRAFT_9686 [Chaetomium olivicolor]